MRKAITALKFNAAKPIMLCLLIGWVCVSCQTWPKHPNIFENPVCAPPCWENIIPGITTKKDALVILTKLVPVDKPVFDQEAPLPKFDSLLRFSLSKDKYIDGDVYFNNDKVSLIHLGINLNMSLQNAIEIFGVPQKVYVYRGGEYISVEFFIPQSGISYSYTSWAQSRFPPWADAPKWIYSEVRPEVEINFIQFFVPDQYEALIPEEALNRVYSWSGYGSIDKYYKPTNP